MRHDHDCERGGEIRGRTREPTGRRFARPDNEFAEAGVPDEARREAKMEREPSPNVAAWTLGEIATPGGSRLKGDDQD